MPAVSIVIVCMNRPDNLGPCLDSIKQHTTSEYEVYVVAYRFSTDNLSAMKAAYPWVNFIINNSISGFSENNNLALKEVPDYPPFRYVLQQWHLYSEPTDNGKGLFRTFNVSGAAFLIKTAIFKELGWFDERYFFTPEDIALSTLARRRGYSVWCDSDAEVIHKWRTTASRLAPALRPASIRGSLIFFSDGSSLRYLVLGAGVWAAEMVKRIKALIQGRRQDYLTYKHNTRSIFTHRSPKQIFIKYFNEI